MNLHNRAATKLAEIEAKIADLQVIAGSLRAALDAGCDDLATCATTDCCPIAFAELDRNGGLDGPAPVAQRRGTSRELPVSG